MNIANKLTLLRIFTIPLYVLFLLVPITRFHYIIACALFIFSAITDTLDGKLARKRGIVTDFGKFADPIADKLVVLSAMICFVQTGMMPAWACIIITAREIIISGFRLICAGKGSVLAASWLGKIKTVTQMLFIIITTFNFSFYFSETAPGFCNVMEVIRLVIMYIAIIMTIWSLVDYIYKNRKFLSLEDI